MWAFSACPLGVIEPLSFIHQKHLCTPSTIQSQLLQRAREEGGAGGARRMQAINQIICLPRRRQTQAQDGGP